VIVRRGRSIHGENLCSFPQLIHVHSLLQSLPSKMGGWVADWLACWTQAQKGPGSNRSRDAVGKQS